ncbi:MAG: hypothetical protein EOP56_09140 [Sphingobacteriales bacterium]|nr:MAG: hypothetical protein EOP56_09140 [Sphingobacteriales bacterium]
MSKVKKVLYVAFVAYYLFFFASVIDAMQQTEIWSKTGGSSNLAALFIGLYFFQIDILVLVRTIVIYLRRLAEHKRINSVLLAAITGHIILYAIPDQAFYLYNPRAYMLEHNSFWVYKPLFVSGLSTAVVLSSVLRYAFKNYRRTEDIREGE